jgi:hypothetical protein
LIHHDCGGLCWANHLADPTAHTALADHRCLSRDAVLILHLLKSEGMLGRTRNLIIGRRLARRALCDLDLDGALTDTQIAKIKVIWVFAYGYRLPAVDLRVTQEALEI